MSMAGSGQNNIYSIPFFQTTLKIQLHASEVKRGTATVRADMDNQEND